MATIPTSTNQLRHVRKTITFTGGANLGNLGDPITVFTTTGRVQVEYCCGYISTTLTCAAAAATNVDIGTAHDPGAWALNTTVDQISGTGWLIGAGQTSATTTSDWLIQAASAHALSADVLLTPSDAGGGADITAGVIVFDAWYRPITDNGALAGDDIDSGYTPIDIATLFTTQMTEAYNADGAAPTLAQALFVIMQLLTEAAISGTTMTVKKLDGSTTAYTLTLDSATSPTSKTRAT